MLLPARQNWGPRWKKHTARREKRSRCYKRLAMWEHSSTFARLEPEIGDNVSKSHGKRKISIEDGAARVRSAPSWTLTSCAIRSIDGEHTRVGASLGRQGVRSGVGIADSE